MNLHEIIEQIKWMPSITVKMSDIVQVIILTIVLYYLTKSLYKTRAWILVKGLGFIGAIYTIICLTKLTVLQIVMQSLFGTLMIAIIIMLQPELQRIVELIGKKKLTDIKTLIFKKTEIPTWYSERTIYEIAAACESMSTSKTGALIVLERGIPLKEYINSGIALGSAISNQLLLNIFEKNTPLHDGAIIITNDRIESATCYLPLSTNYSINKKLGTRHRAALGIAETTDCIVIVVSEETGAISICYDGKLKHNITRTELTQLLKANMNKHNELPHGRKRTHAPIWIKVLAPILSAVIWLSVVTTNDPIITKRIDNVQVTAINTEVLDTAGQTYTIQSGKTISVVAKGRRSLIDNIDKNDIIATADFAQMSIVYAVPIEISPSEEYKGVELSSKMSIMQVSLEDMVQTTIPVELKITGDTNNDYVVMPYDIETKTLAITCSQSIAKTLDKAVLVVDAYGRESDFISSIPPIVYDKNGEVVELDHSAFGKKDIRVTMNVLHVKEVPVEIILNEQGDRPDQYFILNGYSAEYDSIRLAADNDKIGDVNKLEIVLSQNEYGGGANSVLINLTQYLPDGIYLAKDQEQQMEVELDLSKYEKTEVEMPKDSIRLIENSQFNGMIEILKAPETIEIYYNTALISKEAIDLQILSPFVKIVQNKCGTYDGTIYLTEIDGVYVVNDMSIKYRLTEKEGLK